MMNKLARNTVLVAILFIAIPSTSYGVQNGHTWEKMSEAMKIGYLFGLQDGTTVTAGSVNVEIDLSKEASAKNVYTLKRVKEICSEELSRCKQFSKSNTMELLRAIDTLYKNPANRHIPVFVMLAAALRQVNGEDTQLDQLREFWRQK